MNDTRGVLKAVVDVNTQRIVGCHCYALILMK